MAGRTRLSWWRNSGVFLTLLLYFSTTAFAADSIETQCRSLAPVLKQIHWQAPRQRIATLEALLSQPQLTPLPVCDIQLRLALVEQQYLNGKRTGQVRNYLKQALVLAQQHHLDEQYADIYKAKGHFELADKEYDKAQAAYRKAQHYCKTPDLCARIAVSQARFWAVLAKSANNRSVQRFLAKQKLPLAQLYDKAIQTAWHRTKKLSEPLLSIELQLHLSQIMQDADTLPLLYSLCIDTQPLSSKKSAARLQRLRSYACGWLGKSYMQQKQYVDALNLSRRANFLVQDQPQTRFLWERQIGQIYWRQARAGDSTAFVQALHHYQQAISQLQQVPAWFAELDYTDKGSQFWRDSPMGQTYLEALDLFFQQADAASFPVKKQHYLQQAHDTLGQLKQRELENHFQDACISQNPNKKKQQGDKACLPESRPFCKPAAGSAVLYPVVLEQRLVLLLHTGHGFVHKTVDVSGKQLRIWAQRLYTFARKTHIHWQKPATALYTSLIEPLKQELVGIKQLTIVPDQDLYHVPFAALFDGDQFLIENFALSINPLTPEPQEEKHPLSPQNILLTGLAEPPAHLTAQFSRLPWVRQEIKNITENIQATLAVPPQALLDEQFTYQKFHQLLEQQAYQVVHISSHGKFAENPDNSFILTYDYVPDTQQFGLKMNELHHVAWSSQVRNSKLDLLSLSACEVAVSNSEKAAFGLAGAAQQAGTRSVIGTLWKVDDAIACHVMTLVYRSLSKGSLTLAESLQQAQISLLSPANKTLACGESNHLSVSEKLHPNTWAGFLLIGDWQ